jgi:hypothetical protein
LNLTLAPDGNRFAVFPMPDATAEDMGLIHVTFLLNFIWRSTVQGFSRQITSIGRNLANLQ